MTVSSRQMGLVGDLLIEFDVELQTFAGIVRVCPKIVCTIRVAGLIREWIQVEKVLPYRVP